MRQRPSFLNPLATTHNADYNGQPLLINLPLTVTSPPILFTTNGSSNKSILAMGPHVTERVQVEKKYSQQAVKNKEQKGQMVNVTHTTHGKNTEANVTVM